MSSRLAAPIFAAVLGLMVLPAAAQTPPPSQPAPPAAPPAAAVPSPLQQNDAFGEEVMLSEKPIVYLKGTGRWDSAFETLIESFKTLNQYLDKQGIAPNGPAMTIYTQTDDTGFQFRAALPIPQEPKDPPKGDIAIGKSPAGKALKFVHRGSFDAMDTTYEAITNYLDEKQLEAKELFIEEYIGDPVKSTEDRLVVNVYVPVK